jgi:aminoglycoside/choline kinase family phosphotransferase
MMRDPTADSIAEVRRWLASRLSTVEEITALAGDVSPRRYFRVIAAGASFIVALYPEEMRDAQDRFVVSSDLLESIGVRVPRVIDSDLISGMALLEDLGNRTLFDDSTTFDDETTQSHLLEAIEITARIRSIETSRVPTFSRLDENLLRTELDRTWTLFLKPTGMTGDDHQAANLRIRLDELCRASGAQRLVACHRDFMARNLILTADEELAVIDHQDLQLGPPTYDLASLLNDSIYTSFENARALLPSTIDRQAYHRSAAQRCLKIVGTFVSFANSGSPRYLPQVPVALDRFLAHFGEVDDNRSLATALRGKWSEALAMPPL